MPHRFGENYLIEYIVNGYSEAYRPLIQFSPISHLPQPLDPIDINKKILVLGFNGIICDLPHPTDDFTSDYARPHLHSFLSTVFKMFNIVIWSEESLEELLRKAKILNINNSRKYKISGFLDKSLMQTVVSSHFINSKKVKNLEVICGKNDAKLANIVMVEHNPWNMLVNAENGILLSEYKRVDYNHDHELEKLSMYLEIVNDAEDVRTMKHKTWNATFNLPPRDREE